MAQTDKEPRAPEPVPEDHANARDAEKSQPVAESLPVKIGYVLFGLAAVGLCVGAVVAVIGDEGHVTTGGTIAAISAGLLGATVVVGLLVVFHHKRTTPTEATKPMNAHAASRNGKARTSRPAPAKRPTAARS
jgi:hypothetical protein